MTLLIMLLAAIIKTSALTVISDAFKNGESIPKEYTCEGKNQNPSLIVSGIPDKTKSLTVIMTDPDAPGGKFVHWVLFNVIPLSTPQVTPKLTIVENSSPGISGANGKGESSYTGPCPPAGIHHYHFKVYALDTKLDLAKGATKKSVEGAMHGHILAQGELIGLYEKTKK